MILSESKTQNVEKLKTGTTTLAVKFKDGVIVAADKRITAGLFIAGSFDKVVPVSDTILVTIAGNVSDIQLLLKYLKAELKLKELQLGRKATVKEAANLLANWTYNILRSSYGICHFIVSGMNHEGGVIYDVSPDGTILERKEFVSTGSGSVLVYGVMEEEFKKDMQEKEAIDLALRSLDAAMKRDAGSGNGADVFVIKKEGYKHSVTKIVPRGLY